MPKQILLVDDSVTIHRMVEITFAQEEFSVTTVKSTDEGIAKAKALRPDLVLVDVGLAGYDVVRAVRGDDSLSGTACLLLTGNFAPYDEGKGGSVGADGFVVKPFDTQQLIDKAKDAIQRRASAGTAPVTAPVAALPPKPVAAAPSMLQPPPAAARGVEPLGKPLSSVAAETSQRVSAQPAAPIPAAVTKPAAPSVLQPPPAVAARPAPKATLMGIPAVDPATLNIPPKPAAVPAPAPIAAKPVAPAPTPAPNVLRPPVAAPTQPEPPKPAAPTPVAAPIAAKPAASMPANVPQMPRPSLVPGVATPRPVEAPRPVAAPAANLSPAVRDVAQKTVDAIPAAMAAKGPEYEVIAKLSREVIEAVVWEIVPELAESIIRAELDRLVRERQNA